MHIARIKYTRSAIPTEIEFPNKKEAEKYCKEQRRSNPNCRWAEVDTKRDYPVK